MSIPTAEFVGSEIILDVGGRTLTVDCRVEDGESHRRAVAEPQQESYRVLTIVPPRASWSNQQAISCAGLSSKHATVFGEIVRPSSKVLPRVKELTLGRTYVFVWSTASNPVFPDQIEHQALKARESWLAAMVTLSLPISEESKNWLQTFTGLPLAQSATEIVPVWPPFVRKVTGCALIAPENTEVIVYGGQYSSGRLNPVRGMFAKGRSEPVAANAVGVADALFKLVPEREPLVELTCLEPTRVQLRIDFSLPLFQSEDAVELAAVEPNGTEVVCTLHDGFAALLLSRVRSGELEFSHLALPANARGTLYTSVDGIWDECLPLHASGFRAESGGSLKALPPATVAQLKKVISDKTHDVLLDFGPFGRATTSDRVAPRKARRLPSDLRNRLLTFLFQIQDITPSTLSARKMTDVELLAAFSKTKKAGMHTAHWRVLNHALEWHNAGHRQS
ncbi:hypothetical protein [Paraburkholderia caffeinilytica]|uniref:hypothetical protein n=1 Tax=Paraburkholderia caffeinilytica TaxID=1761016 RepID=UPI003DA02A29